jgi:hypothetical protein
MYIQYPQLSKITNTDSQNVGASFSNVLQRTNSFPDKYMHTLDYTC